MFKNWILIGSLAAGVAVALGAHGLKTRVSAKDLIIFETGVRYQFFHALALLSIEPLEKSLSISLNSIAMAFLTGIFIFSGSLYLLVLLDKRWLGAITPIGGVAFLIGWFRLAWIAYQRS